ncbi:cytochrome bc1 complex Rieske iron-sulfur subunit [Terracoccus luteus]|jgi:ubiquinol-cytochrome c reductase iron-sulfur subunit|uniref:Cytochrome bc1 complex Rieske iron-sulfur subunit n=1 Tax=Terracoccus luteus TaxID=53356 RepID=A0A495XV07_9MICO|nr:Rieske 2Fe-2S domain-containing protein [Terracoccus luteus]MBB2984950.1 ubiquinol-cytochrome c reductase iron-sulfur subunit [Terracoccus luteus]MCP2170602.1 ubiquinol-cytochrome c reductase iron-sulfur subunit [Terracoccus luteus]RKT77792.1 menaquinol-cytochrome c reductase iron-sulfur subunit precursor [Terracoccus luteus]
MTDIDTSQSGAVSDGNPGTPGTDLARHDGALPDRFENPGLPAHVHRAADDDPAAAKRAEKQVATLFGLSMLATLVFLVGYFAIRDEATFYLPGVGLAKTQNVVLGLSLGFALFFIGIGAVHWAKTLMSDEEIVEERHPQRSDDRARSAAVTTVLDGGTNAQLGRRPLILYSLGGAMGLFALPFVLQIAGSLGPVDGPEELKHTIWDLENNDGKPIRLMRDPEMTPIKLDEVTNGSVFHVMPETLQKYIDENHGVLEAKAKAAVILIRLDPNDIKVAKARDWGVDGVVAYSKICTHVGCAVGLYEQGTHHLLCPCHQSTFDLTEDCKVIFGPARRPLPQLKIQVDDAGYLVAPEGFHEPVGPSFWERKR